MNRPIAERNIVVLLFLFVLILFSFAQKDTQKLDKLYSEKDIAMQKVAMAKTLPLLKK